jgi:hypothetical protein
VSHQHLALVKDFKQETILGYLGKYHITTSILISERERRKGQSSRDLNIYSVALKMQEGSMDQRLQPLFNLQRLNKASTWKTVLPKPQ